MCCNLGRFYLIDPLTCSKHRQSLRHKQLHLSLLQVLHTELSDLGSLRTAPYLVMFASSNFGGWLGDALITRQQYSVVAARRTVNSIGLLTPPPTLIPPLMRPFPPFWRPAWLWMSPCLHKNGLYGREVCSGT